MILRISLRPLDKFFFGGETSFKEIGSEDTRRSSYVLHSRLFPQQTGALGLIRNQLLLQSGLLADNSSRVKDSSMAKVLIGKHGFRNSGTTSDYGVINRISPVFLESTDQKICLPAPLLDCPPSEKGDSHMTLVFDRNLPPLVENYSEKKGITNYFQHPSKGNVALDNLINKAKQVGITKGARPSGEAVEKKDNEAGYYYQTFLQFKDSVEEAFNIGAFTFFVDLKTKTQNSAGDISLNWVDEVSSDFSAGKYTLTSSLVEFGGERSTFFMEVKKLDDATEFEYPKVQHRLTKIKSPEGKQVKALVCLSPAYIHDIHKLSEHSLIRVTESTTFRFLKSSVDTQQHHNIQRGEKAKNNGHAVLESKRYQLLDRGSTIYFFSDHEEEIKKIFNHQSFEQIGYNQYQIV